MRKTRFIHLPTLYHESKPRRSPMNFWAINLEIGETVHGAGLSNNIDRGAEA
jgi:hypothetical protein